MKDWSDATKWTKDELRDLLANPQPPEDPDENNEFEEWVYFEGGQMKTVRRRNPNYKPQLSNPTRKVST